MRVVMCSAVVFCHCWSPCDTLRPSPTRCVLESADKTNLSRFFSASPWCQDRVNDRRVEYLLQQTKAVRSPKADAILILDDTLCEHVGSPYRSLIFKAVRKKQCKALYTRQKRSPKSPECAVGADSDRSNVDTSVAAPQRWSGWSPE